MVVSVYSNGFAWVLHRFIRGECVSRLHSFLCSCDLVVCLDVRGVRLGSNGAGARWWYWYMLNVKIEIYMGHAKCFMVCLCTLLHYESWLSIVRYCLHNCDVYYNPFYINMQPSADYSGRVDQMRLHGFYAVWVWPCTCIPGNLAQDKNLALALGGMRAKYNRVIFNCM